MQLQKQTVAAQKRVLSAEHLDTLEYMPILARCYHSAGQDEQAAQLGEETFAVRKRVLGVEHPDTVKSMYDLAWYRAQSQYKQAAQLGEHTAEESMYSTQSIQILIDPLRISSVTSSDYGRETLSNRDRSANWVSNRLTYRTVDLNVTLKSILILLKICFLVSRHV